MVTTAKLEYINRVIDECLSEDGEALELNGKFIGDEGVEALVSANRDFDVENLDLSRNKLTWRGAHHLFQSQKFKKLKRLYLGDNNLSDKGIKALPCLLYTSPSPRDRSLSRMPSSA